MVAELFLPPFISALDLGPSIDLPADSLRNATPQWMDPQYPAADRALRYGRGRGGLSYEEIAERTRAALPMEPDLPIHTRAGARRERSKDAAHRRNPDLDELIEQIHTLRHRAFDLPPLIDADIRYEGGEDWVTFKVDSHTVDEAMWTFSLAHPPAILLRDTYEDPAPTLPTAHHRVTVPGVFWLPYSVLIDEGTFPRFQGMRQHLRSSTEPGGMHLFISHRWLARAEPDPGAIQARFFAWQMLAAVCEAIEIAGDRGLHTPRQASRLIHMPIGRYGSPLAESLFVNLLLPNTKEAELLIAVDEVAAIAGDLEDRGSAIADRDHGLRLLRERLDAMPQVRRLLERVLVWYDYSCLPQSPRDAADGTTFRDGLEHLNHIQVIGATAILLDEIDDYLGRGWCMLENIVAQGQDELTGAAPFLIPASRGATNRRGKAEQYNEALMRDAPHLVWRALLDTELFSVQTPETCMDRLGLAVTDPADLPFIYEGLRRMQAPNPPTDDTEVVSGFFPLPFGEDGASIYWRTRTERRIVDQPPPSATLDLDWTTALRLQDLRDRVKERRPLGVPPLMNLLTSQDALLEGEAFEGVHLAIVGSCEGEAALLARWAREHYGDLETMLGRAVVSISWLASDIVPVGSMIHAALQPWPSFSQRWVVISTARRLANCEVAGHLIEMMRALGRPYGELAVDRARQNFRWFDESVVEDSARDLVRYPIEEGVIRTHLGGLYRAALLRYLLPLRRRMAE